MTDADTAAGQAELELHRLRDLLGSTRPLLLQRADRGRAGDRRT